MEIDMNEKFEFLKKELWLLSISASFSTRNPDAPVYARGNILSKTKREYKGALFDHIHKYLVNRGMFDGTAIIQDDVIELLGEVREVRQDLVPSILRGGVLRFGVAQKLVNLYLKYLWVTGYIGLPAYCPIDAIIIDVANRHYTNHELLYSWTTSDSLMEYMGAIEYLQNVANQDEFSSLAEWELCHYRRR